MPNFCLPASCCCYVCGLLTSACEQELEETVMVDACVQRFSDDVDRKFVFEVTSNEGKSYLLQVEDWGVGDWPAGSVEVAVCACLYACLPVLMPPLGARRCRPPRLDVCYAWYEPYRCRCHHLSSFITPCRPLSPTVTYCHNHSSTRPLVP